MVAEPDFRTGNELPITRELLESLAADYKAGRLPDDIKERIEALRDDYYADVRDRVTDLQDTLKPDIEEFTRNVVAQMNELEVAGGITNSEEIDSRQIPIVVNAAEEGVEKLVEPVLDALEDVVHNTFDIARSLIDIRIDHDPEGRYADKLAVSQEELSNADGQFDADMDVLHDRVDASLQEFGQLRDEVEEFHESHAPIRILNSTTVDPGLPDQMAEETGEGVA